MAPSCSYEMAASILLCAEDSSSILDLGAEGEGEEDVVARTSGMRGEPVVEFPVPSEECVAAFLDAETAHMPRDDYAERMRGGGLDLRIRMDAIDWIGQVHTYYNFRPLTACLAINYLDRFLSLYQLPEDKAWMTRLLSVACLSLAAKMEETYVPSSLDLQVGESRYVFESKTIQRMELLVLSTLKWRMQAVTPFSYIDYFLHRLNGGDAPNRRAVQRSAELIMSIARGTHCLDFRPSEIAAAVAAAVAGEDHAVDIDKACIHRVQKERVSQCLEAIQATMALPASTMPLPPKTETPSSSGGRASSSVSVPLSPTGVLDAGCLSCRSDDTAAASHASSWSDENDSSPVVCSKRRKISR
ncbi:hypothetical protein HU200_002474 [Digitaria exilis]|uniref:Cyclin N-terminal domain-containing protein n=1 Tax=Digitaria exilis TaxID=1010633 RepID=A0A835BD37_9POAL|nr:hypothetical protein HU200_037794 [Digitaria exilis]KAF8779579.1 hypothetical protein HU200_002474 [Digitaria exilis]CAB3453639.1 unnamed protein product [Digitaria exilis]